LLLGLWTVLAVVDRARAASGEEQIKVRVSLGHQSASSVAYYLRLLTNDVAVSDVTAVGFEPGDTLDNGIVVGRAGGGDIDALEFTLHYPIKAATLVTNIHRIWADLIAQSDPDTAQRLRDDAAMRQDSRTLTLQMNPEGTRGCSFTIDQLLRNHALWIPALDTYVATGEEPRPFAAHERQLAPWRGQRVLDQVAREPEASYAQFTTRWQDMGAPDYVNPAQVGPGHIVGLTWDSALYKFGIDRGGGVWNDYGNPDRFRLWLDFGDVFGDLRSVWKGQHLADGLPVITTTLARDGVHYELEEFAYPLEGPPTERHGDIAMVLFEKITLHNGTEQTVSVPLKLRHQRLFPAALDLQLRMNDDGAVLTTADSELVLLALSGPGLQATLDDRLKLDPPTPTKQRGIWKSAELTATVSVPAGDTRELVLRLPSPMLAPKDCTNLLGLRYLQARDLTVRFWSDYLSRGAQFEVPEKVVNELFRANLWHALRLPRRHGDPGPEVKVDLPYSNFAYDQNGTPWPVNQAVYVDYMLYDLRGYPELAQSELETIYRNNQEPDGHVSGYANWGVYTPGMLYSVAQHCLLSDDRHGFESLLPQTLQGLDWCLREIQRGEQRAGPTRGLFEAPLNDGTGTGAWAFNQAYMYAGLDLLGKALRQIGQARANECTTAAESLKDSITRCFGAASMRAPLVQLRDHTWTPYVPCEAATQNRLFQQWYPTDVDTGATHLPRLRAVPPDGLLADCLLNDHEDNLYLHGWGMANEPVYDQQASAYLLRDDVPAAIRAFYSMTACAFSHSVFEPVEHRWTWGQYFGPPSTDGAWFELYRRMLIQELDDDTLLLLQAAPRAWFGAGKQIRVERAPTYFGIVSFNTATSPESQRILAEVDLTQRKRPKALLVRLRHPQGHAIQTVTLNGRDWTDFDTNKEWIRVGNPTQAHYSIVARFGNELPIRPQSTPKEVPNSPARP
jgi:hypothetical protein